MAKTKQAIAAMKLNEYQLTSMAYERMNRKGADLQAVQVILELAAEQYPASAIVYSRWGNLYRLKGEAAGAMKSYEKNS